MSRRTFYAKDISKVGTNVRLSEEVSHHISRVLRLKKGDLIELLNGNGNCFQAKITGFHRGFVDVKVTAQVFKNTESPLDIICALALAKSDKLDLAIRQATELGVKKIVLFPSLRSNYRLKEEDIDRKLKRWSKIVTEAMCQSGRTFHPEIIYHKDKNFLNINGDIKIVAYEKGRNGLLELASFQHKKNIKKTILAIGPEGGWDSKEISEFLEYGFTAVRLGPRTMRYETAVVSLITLCQFLWGDMR